MDMLSDFFNFMAGGPALAGLFLVAPIIFLAADWRLSLSALLVQYLLVGITLSRFLQAEVVIVKLLVGLLVVPIIYLPARRVQEARGGDKEAESQGPQLWGMHVGWGAGPLGLPLRLLAFLLVALAIVRLFQNFRPTLVPGDVALAATWLAGMGLLGLILSGESLRVATAALTILSAFDLVYAGLEKNLAIAGLYGALTLLAALAFAYLATVQGLSAPPSGRGTDEETNR